jgi:hypothetical protein
MALKRVYEKIRAYKGFKDEKRVTRVINEVKQT